MLIYLLQGFTLGFAAAAQPGVFQTYLISQTLNNGWRRTVPLTLAPLISDIPVIILMLFILNQLPDWLGRSIRVAGGFFLLYLAYGIWKKSVSAAVAVSSGNSQDADSPAGPKNLLQAVLVNLLNPNPYLGWSLIMGPQFLKGWREAPVNGLALLAGFYPSLIICSIAIILIFAFARQLGPKVKHVLPVASALALAILGIYQLVLGIYG
jgi:threonine/homoserine/homoserine lactone efflux protein